MTHHSETHGDEPAATDEALREAQTGKGYGEDEGEREAAVDDENDQAGAGDA